MSRSALRLRESVRRDGAGWGIGLAGGPAAEAPAEREPACRAAWRAEDRVAGLSDMSKYWAQDHRLVWDSRYRSASLYACASCPAERGCVGMDMGMAGVLGMESG